MKFTELFKFKKLSKQELVPKQRVLMEPKLLNDIEYVFKQMPDPEAFISKMGGRKGLEKLDSDDEIYSAASQRRSALESLPWNITGQNDDLNSLYYDMFKDNLGYIISNNFNAIKFGYNIQEVIWEKNDKFLFPKIFIDQRIDYFQFDIMGNLYSNHWGASKDPLDPFRFFVVRNHPTAQNPYGESLYSRLYWPWFLRCKGWDFSAKLIERFGQPFLVGKTKNQQLQNGTTTVDLLTEALEKAHNGSSFASDLETEIKILETSSKGEANQWFQEAIDKRIRKTILGQTLTSDTSVNGNKALGSVHQDILDKLVISDAKIIEKAINGLFLNVAYINNFKIEDVPVFTISEQKSLESERADRDAKLTQNKVVKFTRKYISENYNLDDEDFEIPEEESVAREKNNTENNIEDAAEENSDENKFNYNTFADKKFTKKQMAVEKIGNIAIDKTESPIPLEDLQAAIFGAESKEDLIERLEVLIGQDNPEFTDTMTKALFAAEVLGYLNT